MAGLSDLFERVGKIIPNEVSKLGGYSQFLNLIPVVGPALNAGVQGVGGLDRFATAYGDTGDLGSAAQFSLGNYGRGADPGFYGSPNVNRDAFNVIGQIGNFLPSYGGGGGFDGGGYASFSNLNNLSDILKNPYFLNRQTGGGLDGISQGRDLGFTMSPRARIYR